ncbi:PcfJ domain-containing protein [Flavobacterium humi]|uniref:PcfJ-like protein n=1 Tax=Flavobacterium humi TaxID=2562683 RepID=A0A4Z0L952_9FLAO|nr:PcfJ domain-containing protein [Flavobacterium humi]TGD58549.1 hypothetical protein E4635_06450 [Flavobacterium humi]
METTVLTLTGNFAVKPKSAFTQLVERLFTENAKTVGNQGTLASVIGTCFASMSQTKHTWKRETFRDLLLHLEAQGCYALLRETACINTLANMAAFGNKSVREIRNWEKGAVAAEIQMSSLIRHCFARYEVPEFLETAFYEENKIHMFWYIQLGRGESVLSLKGFPVTFTRKMAHEFQNVPAHYSVAKAIRWAQAKGYGASADMAETIAWSSLNEHFEHEEFWGTVIRFLVKQETLAYNEVQEVLFYIQNQLEANKEYSMKGRNWKTLLKQSGEWHIEYAKRMDALNRADWAPSGISHFGKEVATHEETIQYNIIELISSEALYEEGHEMSHCVAEYEYDCMQGAVAIFSLRKKVSGNTEILATIEIDLYCKSIVQAKAKYNDNISLEAEGILKEWAGKEKLALDYDEYEHGNEAHIPQPAPAVFREYRAERRNDADEINWKWLFYILFALAKICIVLSK